MSGGVDSSVSAALLVEQGHDVVGVTMRLYEGLSNPEGSVVCGGGAYIEDAQRVATVLGIPHHVIDLRQAFLDNVVNVFAESYAHGKTPNPCVLCNRKIKFGLLLDEARRLGAKALATGHYARLLEGRDGPELHAAVDDTRDQSYFLFGVARERLASLCFPLGAFGIAETRAMAARFRLSVAAKPDSQDVCFVPDGDYASVVRRFHADAFQPGEIVDLQGRVLGRHDGYANFTVGQRRGLNIGNRAGDNNEPLFVVRLDTANRRVVVGPRFALAADTVLLRDVNWLDNNLPTDGVDVTIKLRSTMAPVAARYFAMPENGGRIDLREPVFGVASDQAAVVYYGTRVLGGGWIVRSP
jgi:tRNA-specific 2-thiouridylase